MSARGTPCKGVSAALRAYHRDVAGILRHIVVANGCRPIEASFVGHERAPYDDLHFSTAHQVGSCRMADRPSPGVIDAHGEVFGHRSRCGDREARWTPWAGPCTLV